MSFADKSLLELVRDVFSEKYQVIEEPKKFRGKSGKIWKFDSLIKNAGETHGLFIRDWKREISITQLRQLHKACIDVPEIHGGIMICNMITDFSRDYAKNFGLQILSKGHLISRIRTRQFNF